MINCQYIVGEAREETEVWELVIVYKAFNVIILITLAL